MRWSPSSCCCPHSVSFGDAVFLAGAAGRLNAVTTNFDWNDRFNIWSGLHRRHVSVSLLFRLRPVAGAALPHRPLDRRRAASSLLFNAVAKIPMQFFILFIGAMVFVFYVFVQPPRAVPTHRARAHRAGERVSRRRNPVSRSVRAAPGRRASPCACWCWQVMACGSWRTCRRGQRARPLGHCPHRRERSQPGRPRNWPRGKDEAGALQQLRTASPRKARIPRCCEPFSPA